MEVQSSMYDLLFPVCVIGAVIVVIVYLIFRRIKEKENETFEDRDT